MLLYVQALSDVPGYYDTFVNAAISSHNVSCIADRNFSSRWQDLTNDPITMFSHHAENMDFPVRALRHVLTENSRVPSYQKSDLLQRGKPWLKFDLVVAGTTIWYNNQRMYD